MAKTFISHDHYDGLVAKVMKDVLGRAGAGRVFLDADDIRPSDDWQLRIKEALQECDSVVTILTPEFSKKPWMSAEWACFWATDKGTYVLRLDVPLRSIFAPMTRTQVVDLTSVTSVTQFLDDIAKDNAGNFHLAESLVQRLKVARAEQASAWAAERIEDVLTRESIVHASVFKELISAGLGEQLRDLHLRRGEPNAKLSTVRLQAITEALLASEMPSEELIPLTLALKHSNYQRYAVETVLGSDEPAENKRRFADALFADLSEVARRKVVAFAESQDFPLSSRWSGVTPFGS